MPWPILTKYIFKRKFKEGKSLHDPLEASLNQCLSFCKEYTREGKDKMKGPTEWGPPYMGDAITHGQCTCASRGSLSCTLL